MLCFEISLIHILVMFMFKLQIYTGAVLVQDANCYINGILQL